MWKVRTTKTGSGNTAVQVVRREHQRTIIVKHIGTASNEDALFMLKKEAERFIFNKSGANPLFPELFGSARRQTLAEVEQAVDRLDVAKSTHGFAHMFLSFFYDLIGFPSLKDDLLRDLAVIRIIEPASKRRSLELLKKYFSIHYGRTTLHKKLPLLLAHKTVVEKAAVSYAKQHLGFDFSILFYDVTTLYFETFKEDEEGLRKPGFSKDNKSNQPQIVIGLIVTKEGFPVSYDVFEGNTFEGKTFIPTICKFRDTYEVKNLTVVADAAMISLPNVESLVTKNLSYIVGARTANLKRDQIKEISEQLNLVDGASTRIETERGLLLCDFSFKRYQKDKREMEKQIAKAKKLLLEKKVLKRTKFIKNVKETEQALNTDLVEKTKMLLGVKGYYTNLTNTDNTTIINHYHSLWHVEKAFRIAKSDLEARPIFHHKKESIEVHILIVFISLCMAKSIELLTNLSIKKVKDMIWDIVDIEFTDTPTGKSFTKRINTQENPMVKFLEKLQNVDNILKK
jgi:transposase